MDRPRLLLAEDHAAVAAQLRAVLERDFEVLVTVGDGYALLGAATKLKPDAYVVDVSMPLLDGIAAVNDVFRFQPDARVVFVSVHEEPAIIDEAMATGALGYVAKIAAGEDLTPAVWAALRGEKHLSECLAQRMQHAASVEPEQGR